MQTRASSEKQRCYAAYTRFPHTTCDNMENGRIAGHCQLESKEKSGQGSSMLACSWTLLRDFGIRSTHVPVSLDQHFSRNSIPMTREDWTLACGEARLHR